MSDLVERLSTGRHPVEVSIRPEPSARAFKECLDRGFVHIRFTNTRGGTELGVPIDPQQTDVTGADFDHASGRVVVSGQLTLDFVPVRCTAEIDLASCQGEGWLERVAS